MTADKTPDTTTPTTADLSKRLAACLRFRWLPGMAMLPGPDEDIGPRVVATQEDQRWLMLDDGDEIDDDIDGLFPDLDDPATLGALEFGLLASLGWELRYVGDAWRLAQLGGLLAAATVLRAEGGRACRWPDRAQALVLAFVALESYGAEGQP